MAFAPRLLLLLAVAGLTSVALVPPASAETTTSTTCYGGYSKYTFVRLNPEQITTLASDAPALYMTHYEWILWSEVNGQPGLQTEPRYCTERTIDEYGVIVASHTYMQYPADVPMTP